MPRIGVLALQGDFREHINILRQLGVDTVEVRLPQHLTGVDGLILPGGESTTVRKLLSEYDLLDVMRGLAEEGLPMWGTCAGLILLARQVDGEEPAINALDITVRRNAFGRQVDSFEMDLIVPVLAEPELPFRAVFIRAPVITAAGAGVEILARIASPRPESSRLVAVRQASILATAFHPELVRDPRFHQYFLDLVDER